MVSILLYLRSVNYVHRDIKPANLLLNEKWQLVLADFGTAIQINKPAELKPTTTQRKSDSLSNSINKIVTTEDSDEGPVGTQEYISPEALQGDTNMISFASDLWSFGVIVW